MERARRKTPLTTRSAFCRNQTHDYFWRTPILQLPLQFDYVAVGIGDVCVREFSAVFAARDQRHGRPLRWRPIELAKVWGAQGVLEAYAAVRRVKKDYIMRDAARVAADRNLSFVPFRSLPDATLARLVVHRLNRRAPAAAEPFVLETWRKLFAEGAEIGSIDVLTLGVDPRLHSEIQSAQG